MSPKYRYMSHKYHFEDYSSKGSAVHPVKRSHRLEATSSAVPAIEGASTNETDSVLQPGINGLYENKNYENLLILFVKYLE